jgi:hypothetical protein
MSRASLFDLFAARDLAVKTSPLTCPYPGISMARLDLSPFFAFPHAQEIVHIAIEPWRRLNEEALDSILERIQLFGFGDRPKILEFSGADPQALARAKLLAQLALLERSELAALERQQSPTGFLRRLFARSFAIRTLNPYIFRGPVVGRQFFGREGEMGQLRTQTQRSFVISGVRRSGKTSLMAEAKRRLEAQPEDVVIYVTFENCSSLADIPRALLNALPNDDYRRLAGSSRWEHAQDWPQLGRSLRAFLKSQRGIASAVRFFFDEYDRVINLEHGLGKGGFTSTCRAVQAHEKATGGSKRSVAVQFAFAGSRLLYDELVSQSSDFHNFANQLSLLNFDLKTLTLLITEPLRELGVKVVDPPRVAQAVLEITGGHPSTSQHLCSILTDRLPRSQAPEVGVADVQQAGSDSEFISELRNTIEKNVSAMGRFILMQMAEKGSRIDVKSIRSGAAPFRIRLDSTALGLELASLVGSGYLMTADGGTAYKVAMPVLRDICARFDAEDLIPEILAAGQAGKA